MSRPPFARGRKISGNPFVSETNGRLAAFIATAAGARLKEELQFLGTSPRRAVAI
jgi:hypothetical protein